LIAKIEKRPFVAALLNKILFFERLTGAKAPVFVSRLGAAAAQV
jgi:hypothetical protein